MYKLKPLGDVVIVDPIQPGETAGGIVVPDNAREDLMNGLVIAVGPGRLLEDGKRAPMGVKVGDKIAVRDGAQAFMLYNMGKKVLAVREFEILAICEQVLVESVSAN